VKNVVVPQIKPQLIRKKVVVKTTPTVKVVALPQERKVIKLQDLPKALSPHIYPAPQPVRPVVVQPKNLKRQQSSGVKKKPHVQYRTYDPMPASPARVKAIQATGRGKILVIVANGPSIVEAPLDRLSNVLKVEIMSINAPDPRIWPTTYWTFFDLSQIRRHEKIWDNYDGYIFNSTSIKKQKEKSMQFRNEGGHGWSRDLVQNIYIGRSSVYGAMQIAQWMQFAHIYIFGVDMNPAGIDGKLHFYGTNPDVDPNIRAQRFAAESQYYEKAAEVLTDEERVKYTFCSLGINPWPFMQKYNACEHVKAVDVIIQHAAELNIDQWMVIMTKDTIYVGTSLHNAKRAKELITRFEELGIACTYDWTQHGQVYSQKELTEYGIAEERGVSEADVFLCVFPGRCGTHFEMGLARGLGIPIVLLEEELVEQKTFYYLPGLYRVKTEEQAITTILTILRQKNVDIH